MNDKIELMKEALISLSCGDILSEHKWDELIELSANIVTRLNRKATDSEALESTFNMMNGSALKYYYEYRISDEKPIYPTDQVVAPSFDINLFKEELSNVISGNRLSDIGHILEVIEKYTEFLPASYFGNVESGMSWYDSVKMICAVASCIYDCIQEKEWEEILKIPFSDLAAKDIFLLYSFDTSGIQSFIYTITSAGALKGLRARSFYLEMLMEIIVYELLDRAGLSKANLIYSGGGHAYLLLPNTSEIRNKIDLLMIELKKWLLDTFGSSLFVADGYCECSVDSLSNIPDGSYRNIFRTISERIAAKKMHRYSASEIIELNKPLSDHTRECRICHRSHRLDSEGKCSICRSIEKTASAMMKNDYFAAWRDHPDCSTMLSLPFGLYLSPENADGLNDNYKQGREPAIVFVKNKLCDVYADANCIYVGDYASSSSFEELVEKSKGIERLGVIRADVDNLGQAFVSGYPTDKMTLSLTAAFSRRMSKFFKLYINYLLKNGIFDLNGEHAPASRDAVVVYSGGDDVFIVGSWNDIIGFSVDLHRSFYKYTQGTLSISAGIGMYHEKYPISAMAQTSGELEEFSKQFEDKNAITLFDNYNRYNWDVFIDSVIGEKLKGIINYMEENTEKGNAMLYQMLSLVRGINTGERLNIARLAYFLGRLRPEKVKSDDIIKKQEYEKRSQVYKKFADDFYHWIRNEEDRCQFITAVQLYICLNRKKEEQ
ncbi:MAG TPA: type III-A CRISPR-associated protein Cas10/Csm1 [Ruminococcus sp.]|nr:type III-A CRISPR-associated protein Cas10/Csm1 [Ruminococcus sp.]